MEILPDAGALARHAAVQLARHTRAAIELRGRCVIAVSGGDSPWPMLRRFAAERLPWELVHIVQVDERVAPAGDPARNLTRLRECLPGSDAQIHPMPVDETPLAAAAARYAELLRQLSGSPPMLDLVQLGLGPDGHTASLVPGDPVLAIDDRDVAVTARPYQGHLRMTLTFRAINRARRILWIVAGESKAAALARLLEGDDDTLPANRIERERALLLADREAAAIWSTHTAPA